MKITNDEFAAVVQSRDSSLDSRFSLDSRISQDAQSRYNNFKIQNPYTNISEQDFNDLRSYHMAQLFTAYKEEHDGTAHQHLKWLGSPTTTDPSAIRRVLGNRANGVNYNGPMFLDSETILAVCHIASLRGHRRYLPDYEWCNKLAYGGLTKVVDEMISTKNILLENSEIEGNYYSLQTGSTVYKETGIAQRAIENYASGYFFDNIQHSETAQDFSKRKTNIFLKVVEKFKNSFEKLNNPEAYAKKQQEIGNQSFTPKTNTYEGR